MCKGFHPAAGAVQEGPLWAKPCSGNILLCGRVGMATSFLYEVQAACVDDREQNRWPVPLSCELHVEGDDFVKSRMEDYLGNDMEARALKGEVKGDKREQTMDGGESGMRRTVRHTDVPSALCLPFEEEADRNKETADLSARRLRLLGNIKSICYYSASKKPRRNFKTESKE